MPKRRTHRYLMITCMIALALITAETAHLEGAQDRAPASAPVVFEHALMASNS